MNAQKLTVVLVLLGMTNSLKAAAPSSIANHWAIASATIGQTTKSRRQQSDELLRQARKLMKDEKYDLAFKKLEEADELKVNYNRILQPFNDTPTRLRRDLERTSGQKAARPQAPARSQVRSAPPRGSVPIPARQPQPIPSNMVQNAQAIAPSANGQANPYPAQQAQYQPNGGYQQTPYPGYPETGAPVRRANVPDMPAVGQRPVAGQQLPPAASQANGWAAQKQQAGQLLAQAQMALKKGDVATAEHFAQQAHNLRVPDAQFDANEMRPWMLLLQIDKSKRQSNVVNAGTVNGYGQAVAPGARAPGAAPAIYDQRFAGTVRPAAAQVQITDNDEALDASGFDPNEIDGGLNTPPVGNPAAQTTPPQAADFNSDPFPNEGLEPAPLVESALDLVKKGEEALKDRDVEAARELFVQAWKDESQLDPATRQRLQDHLQLLRVSEVENDEQPSKNRLTAGEQAIVRRFVTEISREQATAERTLQNNPRGSWNRLKDLRSRVADAELPAAAQRQLLARIDASIDRTERFIDQNRVRIEQDERNREVVAQINRERKHRVEVDNKLASMVDEFNTLMDQQRYPEAIIIAKKATEMAPNSPITESMVWKSRFAERLAVELSLRDRMAQGVELALRQTSESAIPIDERKLIEFPEDGDVRYWESLTERRMKRVEGQRRSYSDTEIAIQRALREKVRVSYKDEPLGQVLENLGKLAGISIFLDPNGLGFEGITSEMPVTIHLNQEIQLKSALNLILEQYRLTYIVQDEVLKITSEDIRDKKVYPEVYDVADLVIGIPNFSVGYDTGMAGGLREAVNSQRPAAMLNGRMTAAPMGPLGNDTDSSNISSKVLAQPGMVPTGPDAGSIPGFAGPGGMGGAAQADFDTLIELITATISPDTWEEVGGEGSIQGFPTNLSLVVSNTQDVHEQIADLLEQLRRLQDLQVTIEVRFITLNDNFFERIGVDFDFDVDDNVSEVPGDDGGPSVTIGLDPTGTPTADLDLEFRQDSFGSSIPTIGGFDPNTAATFGFAILSDIEAFFLISAAQGDSRTNVLQAPKVTLFNGQQASVSDFSQRPFVTSVIPVVGDFAAAQQPIILVLNEGTQLTVQAVVSPDRRFVRLTLVPFFSEIGNVETFQFEGRRSSTTGTAALDPTNDGNAVQNDAEDFIEGTTVQLPQFASTSVSTTVSVPDGGTILLGGIKRMSEGRNERGVPMLGKLPYINRLFKNVGIGRTTQSLMMMVTPRIIIQEEEEERLGIALPRN